MTGWYSGPKWIISHSHSGLTYTKGIAWAVTAWKLHDTVIHNIVTYPQLAREGLNWRCCTYPIMHHFHVPQCTIFVTKWCIVWYLSVALSDDLWGVATHHVFVSTLNYRNMIFDIYQVNFWIWKKGKWRAAEVDLVTRLVTRSSWLSKHFHSSVP